MDEFITDDSPHHDGALPRSEEEAREITEVTTGALEEAIEGEAGAVRASRVCKRKCYSQKGGGGGSVRYAKDSVESPSSAPDVRRLEFAMEVGGLAWWEMDCRTGSVCFHRRKTDMLGYEPEPFTHYSHFTALLHADDFEPATQAMRDHLAGLLPEYRIDYRIRANSGAYRWFQDIGRVSQRDEEGRPLLVSGVVLDITDRKRADEALAASEEPFRRMFHGHSAVQLIIAPDTGAIIDANEAAARFYGWSVPELKAMRITEINDLPPEDVKARMGIAVAAPNARFEFRHRLADGSTRDVEVHSNKIEIGNNTYLYSIIHDISDRKRMERELRSNEHRFHLLAENAADVFWVLDLETRRYRYISPNVMRLRGYSADEAMMGSMAISLTESSYRSVVDAIPERIREFERGIERTYIDILEQTRKDGTVATMEVHSRFVRDEESGRLESVGVSRDITERNLAQEAVRAAHERLGRAELFARFGHWEFSLDERIMHASQGARLIYGLPDTDLPLSTIQACPLAEYRPQLDRALHDLIEHNVPLDEEFKIRRFSDRELVHVHSKAEYDPRTKRVFGVVQDITERKLIEEEREQLILELQQAIEQVKTLKGIVPICASCKKIRDDRGYWQQVEAFVARHTDAQFSHGICPDCMARLYPGFG